MDLEKLATSAVTDSISMTDTMSAFITEGDKEPVWDGHIYIYTDNTKRKDNIKKVPVQIKGKSCDNISVDTIKYPIGVSYLKSYLNNGGVMFFVVYINSDGTKKQIYYSALLPIKLRLLLSDIGTQKTRSIELHKFPEKNNDKINILIHFFNNMQRQVSFSNVDLLSEEELSKQGLLECITFDTTQCEDISDHLGEYLCENELYFYAKIKGTNVFHPIEAIMTDFQFTEEINEGVIVRQKQYYDSYTQKRSKGKTEIVIGRSTFITFFEDEKRVNIEFRPTDVLYDALKDIPFILAVTDANHIIVGGTNLHLNNLENTNYEEKSRILKHNLEYCNLVSSLFDKLRLDKNVELSKMTSSDCRYTQMLIDSFLDGKAISGLGDDLPRLIYIDYLNTKLALVTKPTGNKGEYYISDFFCDESFEVFRKDSGKKYPISKFLQLDFDDYLEIGNIDYDRIIDSFRMYSDESYCFDEATFSLLMMIRAYDKSEDKRVDILTQAGKFAEMILSEIAKNESVMIAKLNCFQIEKRIHSLSDDQQQEIILLAEETNIDNKTLSYSIRLGANLLLGNQFYSEYYYRKLDQKTQKEFRNFPIWRFWKGTTEE